MTSVFVDSTTLLYPLDIREGPKKDVCVAWLKRLRDSDRLTMSPQVLNESYWVVVRKPALGIGVKQARDYLATFTTWVTAPMDPNVLARAWFIEDRYQTRFWDSLLLASANEAGCSHFLSEDLNDGQLYDGVRAVNPFRHAPEDVLGRTT